MRYCQSQQEEEEEEAAAAVKHGRPSPSLTSLGFSPCLCGGW